MKPNPRKICVVSGTRAEYGLLYWVLRGIERDRAMELQLVITGSHLSPEFGHTRDVIAGDGFRRAAEVDMLTGDNSSAPGSRTRLLEELPASPKPSGGSPPTSSSSSATDMKFWRLCTIANATPGGASINAARRQYAATEPWRIRVVESLGQVRYPSAMRAAAAVVGNTSSGIIEAPVLGVPTVNIGDRQKGRLRAASVIDCAPTERAIARAIAIGKALSPEFRRRARRARSLYGDGRSAPRIVRVLRSVKLDGILMKRFNDMWRR